LHGSGSRERVSGVRSLWRAAHAAAWRPWPATRIRLEVLGDERGMTRQYSSGEHTIHHGDALEVLKAMPAGSVDLVFADPPYNLGKDFDGWKDRVGEAAYFAWCESWIEECRRVLKADGSFYLMNSTQNMPHLDLFCRRRFEILSRLVWAYDSSGVQARNFFGSLYEPILHMVRDRRRYTFNAEAVRVEAKTGAKRRLVDYRKEPPTPYKTTKVPGNVWEFARVRFRMHEYENHPSQKPEALLARVILASSNPGDLVLDPFGGSFSTAAVARRLGRRSVSMDVSETYVKIGLRRLEIPSHFPADELAREKVRKTRNLSKSDRSGGAAAPRGRAASRRIGFDPP
jgi:adenine-specific DNA-methyltransferase